MKPLRAVLMSILVTFVVFATISFVVIMLLGFETEETAYKTEVCTTTIDKIMACSQMQISVEDYNEILATCIENFDKHETKLLDYNKTSICLKWTP